MGELGFETDTGRSKRGDGSTAWNSLPYRDTIVGANATIGAGATVGSGASLTNPKVNSIKDTNGNTIIDLSTPAASAVNYLRVVNGATSGSVQLAAAGPDANISVNVDPKGTGTWQYKGVEVKTIQESVATRSGTTYTLVMGDRAQTQEFTNGSGVTVTVPPNSSVAFPVGTLIPLHQYGPGQVTISPGDGVTINSLGGAMKISGQYGTAFLRKRDTDEWQLWGDITT